jgi:Ca2+ transporting ATPase
VAATISMAIGIWKEGLAKGWYEGVTIYFAVIIIVSVTAINDNMKEN